MSERERFADVQSTIFTVRISQRAGLATESSVVTEETSQNAVTPAADFCICRQSSSQLQRVTTYKCLSASATERLLGSSKILRFAFNIERSILCAAGLVRGVWGRSTYISHRPQASVHVQSGYRGSCIVLRQACAYPCRDRMSQARNCPQLQCSAYAPWTRACRDREFSVRSSYLCTCALCSARNCDCASGGHAYISTQLGRIGRNWAQLGAIGHGPNSYSAS